MFRTLLRFHRQVEKEPSKDVRQGCCECSCDKVPPFCWQPRAESMVLSLHLRVSLSARNRVVFVKSSSSSSRGEAHSKDLWQCGPELLPILSNECQLICRDVSPHRYRTELFE